jgi:hypothetical protein
MATRTATRKTAARKAPRSVTITLGGPKPAATPKRRSRPTTRRADSLGWRITAFVGKHTWRGVVAGSRWTAAHGRSATVRSATTMGAPVKAWAEDYRTFGRVGHADCACGWRGPTAQLRDHMAHHTGDTPEQRPQRPSGDAVRAGEAGAIRATATRLDRQPDGEVDSYDCRHCDWSGPPHEFGTHVVACPGLGRAPQPTTETMAADTKEMVPMSEIGEGIEALDQYEIDSPHDLPQLYETVAAFMDEVAEKLEYLREDNQAHKVSGEVLAKLAAGVEKVTAAGGEYREASKQMTEDLERIPTYGSRVA